MTLVSYIFRLSQICLYTHSSTRFRYVYWPFPNTRAVTDRCNHGLVAFHATRLETVNHAHQWVKTDEAIP